MIPSLLEILQSLAVILASVAALVGISTWRREFLGKRRIELAEEVLASFYEARDAITVMRSPFSFESEGRSRKQAAHELPQEKEALDHAFVLLERYQIHTALWSRLDSLRYQCIARFGDAAVKPFELLRSIVTELRVSARSLARIWSDRTTEFLDQERQRAVDARREKWESVFWEGAADEDPIQPRVEHMIEEVESICRPIIVAAAGQRLANPLQRTREARH
jgi:hypothetical protein